MSINDKQPEGSAKVSVSFPPELLKWINAAAKKDRRARSTWIAIQLEKLLQDRAVQESPDLKGNKRRNG